jgi:RsiW-degrading membrane proteinase PrsW (M82 family)
MIGIYIVIAVFIAWIWVDYYRLIDIYENEKLKYFIPTFILGCSSVFIVLGLNKYVLESFHFQINGEFVNDFLYCIFKIGMVEEFAKTMPFVIVLLLFKKQLNEPIDYLAFISISALGFSAAENVLYFHKSGPSVINGRAILSTVGHMFDTSLIAYGIIRYKYFYKNKGIFRIIFFFFLAAFSHGFYDFWLIYEGTQSGGWIITILYYFVTISVFAVIINNAINNSTFFTYKKVINSDKVAGRLVAYYSIVFLCQLLLLSFFEDMTNAFLNLRASIFSSGFIIAVTSVRLSRFKLIKDRWENLKLEMPFTMAPGDTFGRRNSPIRIRIKGDSYNETFINQYYEEYFELNPISTRNTYLENTRNAFIERKIFLKDEETFYLAKVFHAYKTEVFEMYLLKPKTANKTMVNEKHPIVAVLKIENIEDIENTALTSHDFEFLEWAYITPQAQL